MRPHLRNSIAPLLAALVAGWLAPRQAAAEELIDYTKQIKPVLQSRCYACHGALKQKSNLRLDTAALAIKGGKGGPAVKVGDPEGSELMARVTAKDDADRMPPEGEPLSPAQIAALRAWIAQGAKAPADEQPERDPREHWAFQAPKRPAVPKVADAAWSKNPIDAFIAAEREKRGLAPQPAADKRIWLRRVTIDLTGLPPTRAEMDAFVADTSPDAYDEVVARLLSSPQYGERWGRHWMDIWRFSDWWGLGAEVRNSQKHIWHWRDWIIESLNADKGYDQMLREMLAADELYPTDLDKLRAGGFLARQYFRFNRTSWLDEAVEHTGKAMLGLTFNCAKCHDHKYDPISQIEYYQLRAFFEPYQVRTDFVSGELDAEKNGIPRPFDCNLDAPTYLHVRGDDRNPDKSRAMPPLPPAFLAIGEMKIAAVELPVEAHQPGLRPFVIDAHLKQARQRIEQLKPAVATARKKLEEAEKLAKAAAKQAKDDPAQVPKPAPTKQQKLLAGDNFAAAKPDLWAMRGGAWAYADGKLTQSQTGATRVSLRLKPAPPADFEARLKYIPTGGDMWKSIGISFDVTEQGHMVTAYLSSYAGGPKSQITYKHNGGDVYPPEAAQSRKVDLNQVHEITLRVRGPLINVLVDGEPSIAYRLPIERRQGALELSTFDAKAQFLAFELRELPADLAMDDPGAKGKDGPLTLEVAAAELKVAETALAAAMAQVDAVEARAAAMRATHARPAPDDLDQIVAKAARAELGGAAAAAAEAAARAELEWQLASGPKEAEARKKRDSANAAMAKAREAAKSAGKSFTPLVGAVKTPESNLESDDSRRKPFPVTSTGRRTALAGWITDARNPLTARVAVNHLWSRHMGAPLVATVFDFGRKGAAPTHPQLLDWLAVELIESGWSMKHIHRLIVTSQTYRMTSSSAGASSATLAGDPDNRHYWRANAQRMESQVVRDSLLHLAGDLDLARGGPSVPASDESSRRRSLYFFHSHNEHQKFLATFDDADVLDCYRRSQSIVPQQALALQNSALAAATARKIAEQLAGVAGADDRRFVRMAFLAVLCTEPNEAELTVVLEALARFTDVTAKAKQPDAAAKARANLVHALLNHNDFVTVR